MKRIIKCIFAVSLLAALCSAALSGKAASGEFYGLTGAWDYEGEAFCGKSGGAGDVFAISERKIAPDDLFIYEATVSSVTDNPDFNASLVFGLKNPADPKERFYDFGIMTGSSRYIRFDQTNGYPESGVDVGAMKTEKNTYEIKIVRISEDAFDYFVDGERVLSRIHPDFEGGHIGMMTNDNGKYENVKLTVTGKVPSGENGFVSDLTGWTPINGKWRTGPSGYTAVTAGGDTWAYAKDMYITPGTSFVYGADMELKDGNHAAGIIFGVLDPEDKSGHPDRLFSFLTARGDGNVMVFTHKDGAAEWIEAVQMTEADKKAEKYSLRMEYISDGSANFYVNGTLYRSLTVSGYEGGHVGLMVSAATSATFNNVRFTEAKEPALDDLRLSGGELDSAFSPADHTYWSYVPYSTKSVSLTASFDGGRYEVGINGSKYTAGTAKKVALGQGGNAVTVSVKDKATGVSSVYTVNVVREPDAETLYKETTRPQYHFTPYSYQMNDPNGLVYNSVTGEYHLFFQCNRPFDTGVEGLTGTTSWGHAVSKDLLHWEELPLAVLPDEIGMAWSGSAVIDENNTSGLFDDSTPPGSRMVLFYASVGGDSRYGYAKESMAYSKDGGRTFIKYEGNPVVRNPGNKYGGGLRDPRVFWYEDETADGGGIWVMVTVGELNIFTSHDLKNWKSCGRPVGVDGKYFDSECPDLYPLPVDGDENDIKWVYTGGGIFYILGHMEKTGADTVMFVPETERIYALNGIADQGPGNPAPETYATQTFSAEPKGRRVSISWLRDPSHFWGDKHWNSAQSIPVEHSLKTVNGKIKLFSYPVEEVDAQRGDVLFSLENTTVTQDSGNILGGVKSVCCDIVASVIPGDATELGFKVRAGKSSGGQELVIRYVRTAGKLYVDKTKSGAGSYIGVYEPDITEDKDGRVTFRIMLDRICFDVYGCGGEAAVAGLVYADMKNDGMEFFTNGSSYVEYLTVYDMDTNERRQNQPDGTGQTEPTTEPAEDTGKAAADETSDTAAENEEKEKPSLLIPAVIAGATAAVAAAFIVALRAKKKKRDSK